MNHATRFFAASLMASATLLIPMSAAAQNEGLLPTQTLVRADSKEDVIPTATAITLQLNGKATPVTSLMAVPPGGAQVALLIDDGLSRSAGIELNDLRNFPQMLPAGTEVYVGYMRNGTGGHGTAVHDRSWRCQFEDSPAVQLAGDFSEPVLLPLRIRSSLAGQQQRRFLGAQGAIRHHGDEWCRPI